MIQILYFCVVPKTGADQELYLCELLMSTNFIFGERNRTGPDFMCTHLKVKGDFYFEAISVKPGEGKNNAQMKYTIITDLNPVQEIPVISYDANPLKLRITQGIQEKSNKFKRYLEDSVIPDTGFLVLAVHYPHEMGFLSGISGLTVFHESVFPLGPITIAFDTQTHKPIREYNSFSPIILKHNGTEISTDFFLSDASNHISGLLFSDISYTRNAEIGSSVGFIHNPMAKNPLPKGLFGNIEYGEWEASSSEGKNWQILRI